MRAKPILLAILAMLSVQTAFAECEGVTPTGAESAWVGSLRGKSIKGITLVVHGLNTKPEKMLALAKLLEEQEQMPLLVKLTGHRSDLEAFKTVTREIWLKDLERSYCRARKVADTLSVDVNLLAYSLGAVSSADLVIENRAHFARMILFAPAISVRSYTKAVLSLEVLGKDTLLPSASPPEYRANPGTSVAAYAALFDLINHVNSSDPKALNVPTTVFLDASDELVSSSKLRTFQSTHNLNQWNFVSIKKKDPKISYHHLIIDEASASTEGWKTIKDTIAAFFPKH